MWRYLFQKKKKYTWKKKTNWEDQPRKQSEKHKKRLYDETARLFKTMRKLRNCKHRAQEIVKKKKEKWGRSYSCSKKKNRRVFIYKAVEKDRTQKKKYKSLRVSLFLFFSLFYLLSFKKKKHLSIAYALHFTSYASANLAGLVVHRPKANAASFFTSNYMWLSLSWQFSSPCKHEEPMCAIPFLFLFFFFWEK